MWLSYSEYLAEKKANKEQNRRRKKQMRGKSIGSVPTSLHKHLSFVRNKMKASSCPSAVIKGGWFTRKTKIGKGSRTWRRIWSQLSEYKWHRPSSSSSSSNKIQGLYSYLFMFTEIIERSLQNVLDKKAGMIMSVRLPSDLHSQAAGRISIKFNIHVNSCMCVCVWNLFSHLNKCHIIRLACLRKIS
jgi:hypothetical protein